MRLTLRTLLAYMDNVLEPSDQEAIKKKIEASEFASDLLHKSRDTMRRLRLGAPNVFGGDGSLDPNTVAEYIDNTLSPEQVADYERVCLESDIHLAEVSSCHQILTMVLGEPAEIDPAARRRMYDIPAMADVAAANQAKLRIEPAHAETAGTAADGSALQDTKGAAPKSSKANRAAASTASSETDHVPEWLRQTFFQRHRGKLAIAAMFLIAAAAFVLWPTPTPQVPEELAQEDGQLDMNVPKITGSNGPSANVTGTEDLAAATNTAGTEAPAFNPGPVVSNPANPTAEEGTVPGNPGPTDGTEASEGAGTPPGETAAKPPLVVPEMPDVPTETPTTTPETNSTPPELNPATEGTDENGPAIVEGHPNAGNPGEGTPAGTNPAETNPAIPPKTGPEAGSTARPGGPSFPEKLPGTAEGNGVNTPGAPNNGTETPAGEGTPKGGEEAMPNGAVPNSGDGTDAATNTGEGANAAEAGSAAVIPPKNIPQPPRQVATYLASESIILRLDSKNNAWVRLAPRTKIFSGDLLLAPPAMRPTLALASGINVQLTGGSRLIVRGQQETASGNLALVLEPVYGRLILDNTQLGRSLVSLQIGKAKGVVNFDGASTLAISVERKLPAGADPLVASAEITAEFYATSGALAWQADGTETNVTAPSTWKLEGDKFTLPTPAKEKIALAWIDGTDITNADRLAAPKLADALTPGQPTEIKLQELVDSTRTGRRELRSLASRTSVHTGQFEPFVAALNDADQYSVWNQHIATLEEALSLGPEVAKKVREAFRTRKGKTEGDALFRLLWGYSKKDLDKDLLAKLIHQLEYESLDFRVLAFNNLKKLTGKRLNFRPHDTLKNRQRAVKEWLKRLNRGELLPKP